MKITVLVDNNTHIDHYYKGEPALCFYVEDEDIRLLFDTGYSDLFLHNACSLGIDLSQIKTIVLSHGHNDHTGGMEFFYNSFPDNIAKVIAHPNILMERFEDGKYIGIPLPAIQLEKLYNLKLTKSPLQVSNNLMFLGEIPSYFDFERRQPIGLIKSKSNEYPDFVLDDTALVYKGKDGLFIITGCSHSGICNIIQHAKKVCDDERILGIIGGFHLFDVSSQLDDTIAYFKENQIANLYPCHCVSFEAKAHIHKYIKIVDVAVGLSLYL